MLLRKAAIVLLTAAGLGLAGAALLARTAHADPAAHRELKKPAPFVGERLEREELRSPKLGDDPDWCAPELETLPNNVCYAKGPLSKSGKRTLVIFLHGLVEEGAGWQHQLQKGMANAGKRLGFSLFTPRGRTHLSEKLEGAKGGDTISWPTHSREIEDQVIAEWMGDKAMIEKREGAPFDEVFVMGFSNGAYYAASLALRGRLDVDGYGVFAGGSAPQGTVATAKSTTNRRPIFVGVAAKDDTAKKSRELGKALKALKWPSTVVARPVGHTVADDHLEKSLEFLRSKKHSGAAAIAASVDDDKDDSEAPKKATKKGKKKSKKTADREPTGSKAKKKKSSKKNKKS